MTCAPDATVQRVEHASRSSYRELVDQLAGAQKSRKGGGGYSVYVNRPLGRRAAAAAHLLGMGPNQVTLVSAAFTFAGLATIASAPSGWATGAAVTALLVVGYALDAADGQLARLRGGGSVAGEWLDHTVDALKLASLHGVVLIHLYRSTDLDGAWYLVPLGFTVANVGRFFAQLLNEQLRRARGVDAPASGGGASLVALVKLPCDYGILCWVFLLLGAPRAFGVAYAAFFAANAAYLLLGLGKWFREMQALDEAARR